MLGKNPLIVVVSTPVGKPVGQTMNAIRSWLDRHKIQTTNFKVVPCADGNLRFEIAFHQEHEAERFRQEFAAEALDGMER